MTTSPRAEVQHVIVAGAGVAGLEALLALRALAEERVSLTMIGPDPDFTYRPLLVDEPFLTGIAERYELAPIAEELGADFVREAVTGVRPDEHVIELADGSTQRYDMLLVCLGGKLRAPYRQAFTFPPIGRRVTRDERLAASGRGQGRWPARVRRCPWSHVAAAAV